MRIQLTIYLLHERAEVRVVLHDLVLKFRVVVSDRSLEIHLLSVSALFAKIKCLPKHLLVHEVVVATVNSGWLHTTDKQYTVEDGVVGARPNIFLLVKIHTDRLCVV